MIDGHVLRKAIADAVVACADSLASEFGDSGLYGFALYTLDDIAGTVVSASYEKGFEKRRKKALADKKNIAWLKENKIDVQRSILGDWRWSIYEWEHECFGKSFFDPSNKIIYAARNADGDDEDASTTNRATILAAMVRGLQDADARGAFSKYRRHGQVTLFCSVPNSSITCRVERESAAILNASDLFQAFSRERISWIEEDRDRQKPYRGSVAEEFLRQLSNSK